MTDLHSQKILILDFGSQYTQLIARRIREIGVFSEIRAWDITEQEIREFDPQGIILSGGPESVTGGAKCTKSARLRVHHGIAHIRNMLRHADYGRSAGWQG